MAVALGTALGGSLLAAPALAGGFAASAQAGEVEVRIVEVSGLIDRVQVRFLESVLEEAAADEALVVRLDSGGAVASSSEMAGLEAAIRGAGVPVAVWLGPSRDARAVDGAERIARAADVVGGVRGAELEGGAVAVEAPTLGDFIVALDGRGGIQIPTRVVRGDGDTPKRELGTDVRVSFAEPPFVEQMLHAVSTPTASYLLLSAGLLLLVFEFYTGGIGVAAAVAAVCLAFAGFGLGALPTRPGGLALLLVGVFGFSVDVQVGVPRAWTWIGTLCFALGSLLLFDGVSIPLFVVLAMLAAVVTAMVAGMPAVVRTRYSTPTIGRESMIGEEGRASTDVAPEGVVTVRDAPWRARTNRATPIRAGDAVRVAAIEGLVLEVEPLEGAAEDYRERARRAGPSEASGGA